jgi:hypothetical protein
MAPPAKTVPTGDLIAATCPRCGGGFGCGAQAGRCDCFDIHLTEPQRQALAARYSGCLCLPCLRELAAGEAEGGDTRPAG